ENSMQSLCKSNFNVTRYLSEHPKFKDFWQLLFNEYETAVKGLLDLSGQPELLADNPASKSSITLREAIIQPLIAIQQYALQQLHRANLAPEQETVYRKMVLRAMFGIINAARNAA
ncbi:phosphoenolpyruvate carboxylase, partial [candidate division KSB1 bacterium]|nr:phosphoenolpyruvate carboxylase [candidate division KSB1 bacterium]